MNNGQLQNLLGSNVLELTFVRRHPKLGWSDIRGLFGTTNFPLLNGEFGHNVLHFQPPKGIGMGYDYRSKGLCVVWDLFRQEYRVFGAEQVEIRKQFPISTPEEEQEFLDYFNEFIAVMSNQQKIDFMGYVGNSIIPQQVSRQLAEKRAKQQEVAKEPKISNKLSNIYQGLKSRMLSFFKKKS